MMNSPDSPEWEWITPDAPRHTAWTNEKEIALCKGWIHVSENSKKGNARKDVGFWTEVLQYFESKTKAPIRRVYDMINGKWKTVRLNVAWFCGTYANVMRRAQESEAGDEDYYNRALLDYEAEHGMQFTLLHCWESGDASINMNVDVGDDEEDEVEELRRPMGRDKAKGLKKKELRSSGSSSSTNDEALARLMVSELAMHNERAIGIKKE
ncbi:hypothetical protein Tco_0060156 [Tanacetum coccineum]